MTTTATLTARVESAEKESYRVASTVLINFVHRIALCM